MVASLTNDQLTLLRLARGDALATTPLERPRTRHQDRGLLLTLRLIERRGATFALTALGAAYLERVEAELQAERWEEPARTSARGGR